MKNETVAPAIRIFLAMKNKAQIKKILEIIGIDMFVYVETTDKADLIIFSEMRDIIERGYDEKKSYIFLKSSNVRTPMFLSKSCIIIDPAENLVVELLIAMNNISDKLLLASVADASTTSIIKNEKRGLKECFLIG